MPTPAKSYRIRKDGLPHNVQRQLLVDLEGSGKELSGVEICDKRLALYGEPGTDLRRRVQNKRQVYKNLKKEDPAEYW
jgi:hypothetical protein